MGQLENASVKAAGAFRVDEVRCFHSVFVRHLDDSSAILDLVWTYSIHHVVVPRAAVVQNRFASSDPVCDDDDPLTRVATTAWLSMRNAQVRAVLGHSRAQNATRIDARNS